jgi:o-succinylbenzoate synthase
MYQKPVWYIFLYDNERQETKGIGECSYIPGLNAENENDIDKKIEEICNVINRGDFDFNRGLPSYPSINFGIETALTDLQSGGERQLFPSDFVSGKAYIPINGLIWMGKRDDLIQQINDKLRKNYRCLKLKIGALDFDEELEILSYIRRHADSKKLELRVDANGAFKPSNVMKVLEKLSRFDVHSIEQPIPKGQWKDMAYICNNSPVPIALDEELSGHLSSDEKAALINQIKPQYLVLKPGLLGGFNQAIEYIQLARKMGISWWITSSLESNIGLSAIAQWTYTLGNNMPQGLGTGLLYKENVQCPLELSGDRLCFNTQKKWDLSFFKKS